MEYSISELLVGFSIFYLLLGTYVLVPSRLCLGTELFYSDIHIYIATSKNNLL